MTDCLFCNIIAGEIPANRVFEDEDVFAFRDITPQAPVHVLIVPKKHTASVSETTDEHLLGKLVKTAGLIAHQEGYAEKGYRIVANTGNDGGQTVFHLHFHLLAGRAFSWPPG